MTGARLGLLRSDDRSLRLERASLFRGDALCAYEGWRAPTVIVSDGPYGLGKYKGEPKNPDSLAEWYAPHAAAWAKAAKPNTTLWFWNSEIGWAKAHPALELHGWVYQETAIWDKGLAHVAGNVNSRTIRGLPVVTEVAVRYTRAVRLATGDGLGLSPQEWLRAEWRRSGLPLSQANEACGVANAATRKYLTACHLWYCPPGEAVVAMARWCERFGLKTEVPYFSLDGRSPPQAEAWDGLRAKWTHFHGLTNVWREPAVHGAERVKARGSASALHANQKPLALMMRQILASSDEGDVVWEPFGGLMSASVAAVRLRRVAHAAEPIDAYFASGAARVRAELAEAPCAKVS
ncbi:MAG TPA: DNA methyltransferase [Methylocystis sp.]|nr:DNA methyltransferase [Methylocystis sp.]